MLVSYNWNYPGENGFQPFYNGKPTLFLRLPLHEIQNSRPVDVWKQVHCGPHLYKVNWLLESIFSIRISLLPEPYKYHFHYSSKQNSRSNITNRIIIFELSLLAKTLSRLHWGVIGVLRSVRHVFIQIKYSLSFVLQVTLPSCNSDIT